MKKLGYLFFILSVSGCSLFSERDRNQYSKAIVDAAVVEDNEIRKLSFLQGDEGKKIKVVTWTEYPDKFLGEKVVNDWDDIWVTLDNAVKNKCKHFNEDRMFNRLRKLLGLPPDEAILRKFVTIEVSFKDLFRPCANPSLVEDSCSADFPENISSEHMRWYAKQVSISYRDKGFPWTRLGYTYDWGGENNNEFGVEEFVIRKNSEIYPLSIEDTGSYCIKD